MVDQLILPMGVDASSGLANFIDTPNKPLLAHLKQVILKRARGQLDSYTGVFIRGESGCGKSHLLDALSDWAEQCGTKAYRLAPEATSIVGKSTNRSNRVYLLDDIELFLVNSVAEHDLLTVIERIKQQNASLFITARVAVKALGVKLPDFTSRLQAMDNFELITLDDQQKREVLNQRATQRGIVLSEGVLNWMFVHTSRELGTLLDLLDRIDVQSLSQKRRVTIPLIKSILER